MRMGKGSGKGDNWTQWTLCRLTEENACKNIFGKLLIYIYIYSS